MNFKETFLKLTEYTIPFGYEKIIIPFLKEKLPALKKDKIGNYYITIGESETLFTTHLDTYSKKVEKVNHIIEDDWIGTDGKTILGGDNKNGTTILLYLIEKGVPGTYYFFIGEEPIISGGLYGSSNILRKNPDFFKKFKRAIAFDRKKNGSIVVRQMARKCCSNEFADYLISEFERNGLEFSKDPNAWYTDTAAFLDVIPEITNISAGGWGEHTNNEKTLISYTESVAKAASNIKWEESPVVREPKIVSTIKNIKKFKNIKKDIIEKTKITFNNVDYILDLFGYRCLNEYEFDYDIDLVYSHWHKDSEFIINIKGEDISINNNDIGDFSNFKKLFNINFESLINFDEFYNDIIKTNKEYFNIKDMDNILKKYYLDSNDLIDYLSNNNELEDIIKYENNKFIKL